MTKSICQLKVNGERYELLVDPWATLAHVLRESLDLTGTKLGCEMGECGACTVLLDGKPVMACILLALDAQDQEIQTIEGVASGGKLHPLQQQFAERGAAQCGFCTPGMILSAKALLDSDAQVNEASVKQALSGNHCRCTGYTKIIEAVLASAEEISS